jgi:hypothetical protein
LNSTGEKLGLLILILICIPSLVFAVTARVTWNRNTEGDLAGYWVYYGTSPSNYDHLVGVSTTPSIDITGLEAGKTYYFAVTARDTSGNQSGFSQQVSVTIPAATSTKSNTSGTSSGTSTRSSTGGNTNTGSASSTLGSTTSGSSTGSSTNTGSTGTGSEFLLKGVVDRVGKLIKDILGLGPNDPLYSLSNSGSSSQVPARQVSQDTIAANMKGFSLDKAQGTGDLTEKYPVRDVIFQALTPFDLAGVYPDGIFFFYPLETNCPDINGDTITVDIPGCYSYMVFDEMGDVVHVLRLSVAEQIYQLQTYNPANTLLLEDEVFGVAIDMPVSATPDAAPIAIGWGGDGLFSGSTQLAQGEQAIFFDILPYGLALDEPATVSVPYKGSQLYVLRYDENNNTWVTVEDAKASGGYVTFSTQVLGRFKVTDQAQDESGKGGHDFFNISEDTCFVESARCTDDIGTGCGIFITVLAALFSYVVRWGFNNKEKAG